MAMTLRLDQSDDCLLSTRPQREAQQAGDRTRGHTHLLTEEARRIEDLEDAMAIARYELRKQLGEVTYISHTEARTALGLDKR